MTNKFLQKQDRERKTCDQCGKDHKLKDLYRLSWRYTDKKKYYRNSMRGWIHTGYKYICAKCLKDFINE